MGECGEKKKDFTELVEYLDKKFQKTAAEQDLADFATKFLTLKEFDSFRAEIKQEFAALRESINSLTNVVDQLVKAVSDLRTEYFAISHQLSRHEKWIQKLAEKVDVELS